jgi:hypothetical protein
VHLQHAVRNGIVVRFRPAGWFYNTPCLTHKHGFAHAAAGFMPAQTLQGLVVARAPALQPGGTRCQAGGATALLVSHMCFELVPVF